MDGGCACGAVRYRLITAPMFVNCCHCTDCQTETGSAFVINALIERDRIDDILGNARPVMTPSASGKGQEIERCPGFHVVLWSHYSGAGPNIAFVRVGTLDEPNAVKPVAHIFTRSKLAWVTLPEGVPAFDVFYPFAQTWSAESIVRFGTVKAG